jgi:FdhD protein
VVHAVKLIPLRMAQFAWRVTGNLLMGPSPNPRIEGLITNTKKVPTLRITEHDSVKMDSTVAREFSLTIVLNGQELVTLLCSPTDSQFLAVGFIQSQGLIKSKDDIKNISADDRGAVRIETKKKVDISPRSVLTSSGGKGPGLFITQNVKKESQLKLSTAFIFSLMEEFDQRSEVFKTTGGTHSAALCNAKGIVVFSEDIGRHNAIDKMFGQCLLQDIAIDNCFVLFSGRISSEILLKVAARGLPILIARNAPTDLGIKLANDLGITLVGFARGKKMTVYANDWRIVI